MQFRQSEEPTLFPADEKIGWREWPHAPPHLFVPGGTYLITCGTYQKAHYLNTPARLTAFRNALFDHAEKFGWQLEAWAILINHYHLVATTCKSHENLDQMLRSLHSKSAIELNRLDNTPGRKVWYRYRDTLLTNPRSYMARLHYVHRNPERHGVVERAENYEWCSMGWFLRNAKPGFKRTVLSFKIDQVKVPEDF